MWNRAGLVMLSFGLVVGVAGTWLLFQWLDEPARPGLVGSQPPEGGTQPTDSRAGAGPALTPFGVRPFKVGDDRHEDYIMSTGPVSVGLAGPDLDGVWLLDYRAGKLLGTAINRVTGKISGWAEVDLVTEFQIPPRTNVHFLMTTGVVARGQSALYVAETATGKFSVYSMAVAEGPRANILIKRHDMVLFRPPPKPPVN